MSNPPPSDEWDQLVAKVGTLTLATGTLKMTIVSMGCRIVGQTEEKIDIHSNSLWCRKLNEVAPSSWLDEQRFAAGFPDLLSGAVNLRCSKVACYCASGTGANTCGAGASGLRAAET
jgi:hypothetical protein